MGFIKSHELHTIFSVRDRQTKEIVHNKRYDSKGASVFSPQFDDKAKLIVEELQVKYPSDRYEVEYFTCKS